MLEKPVNAVDVAQRRTAMQRCVAVFVGMGEQPRRPYEGFVLLLLKNRRQV